jgi:hypothetical protein
MPEVIKCPGCQRHLQVPENYGGETVQCPKCARTFVAFAQPAAPPPLRREQPPYLEPPRPPDREDDYDEFGDDYSGVHSRRDYFPHRGTTILSLGILSLIPPCCPILGPIAWYMGNADLREMRAGRMDPEGEGYTNAGRICGIVATCIFAGIFAVWILAICAAAGGGL